jgi:DNA-binding CsgD family transcriptional regulator
VAAKPLHQALTELRSLGTTRLRRQARGAEAAPLIARLLTPCKTLGTEDRAGGVVFRLQGTTERGAVFHMTCVLHHSGVAPKLTTAEKAVAEILCDGRTLAQIARLRGVSPNTVKSQIRQIFRKLNVESRVALVREMGTFLVS